MKKVALIAITLWLGAVAWAQSVTDTYSQAGVRAVAAHLEREGDGGASLAVTCQASTDDAGFVFAYTGQGELAGASQASALNFLNNAAFRACVRYSPRPLGDAGTP